MKSEAFPTLFRCGMVLGTMESHCGVFGDLEQFVSAHRACGTLTGGADAPTPEGYRLLVCCSCGELFARWVTPEAAEYDLLRSRLPVFPN